MTHVLAEACDEGKSVQRIIVYSASYGLVNSKDLVSALCKIICILPTNCFNCVEAAVWSKRDAVPLWISPLGALVGLNAPSPHRIRTSEFLCCDFDGLETSVARQEHANR
jgi:hypothetical protein